MISAEEARNKIKESLLKISEDAVKLADLAFPYDMDIIEMAINIAISENKTRCDVDLGYHNESIIDSVEGFKSAKTKGVAVGFRLKRAKKKLEDAGYLCEVNSSTIEIDFS